MADWTILKILSWTESYFNTHSIDSPRLAAEILLSFSLNIKRLDLYLEFDRPLHSDELKKFRSLIQRRIQGEPVAYITGSKGFWDSEFSVTPEVLIPRPDTETIVEAALDFLSSEKEKNKSKKILELGAGSGAIIISLARVFPKHHYFANDFSFKALKTAVKNCTDILEKKINFFNGSWLSSVKPEPLFDIIVSNPPYIPSSDIDSLQTEIKDYEPRLALDGGENGFDCIKEIIRFASFCLLPKGTLLLEIGFDQYPSIKEIAKQHDQYTNIHVKKDLAGNERVVILEKKNCE